MPRQSSSRRQRQPERSKGSEADNVIDYRASYAGRLDSADKRLVEGLNYLNSAYRYDADALVTDNSRFTISNLDTTGAIVPLYTNISADRTLDVDDILNYYKLSTIAKSGNQEIEIFQMFKDRPAEYATVGWVAVADLACNVFVPYYPMLIDSMYEGYQAGTPTVQFTTEQPTGGLFYPYSKRSYNRETGEITTTDGYRILPEGWEKSYYWSFEILNDYVRYFESADGSKLVSDADRQFVKTKLNELQQEFYSDFVSMQTLQSSSNARKLATENGAAMAKKAQQTAQELICLSAGLRRRSRAPTQSTVSGCAPALRRQRPPRARSRMFRKALPTMTPSFGQQKPASSAVSATAALPRTRPAPARRLPSSPTAPPVLRAFPAMASRMQTPPATMRSPRSGQSKSAPSRAAASSRTAPAAKRSSMP